jgi:hypothetical protein
MMIGFRAEGSQDQKQTGSAGSVAAAAAVALSLGISMMIGNPTLAAAQAGPDLSVVIVADRNTANTGRVVTYTITVSNLGDATATGVALWVGCSDNLQCGFVSAIPTSIGTASTVTATMSATANPCGLSIDRYATVRAEVTATGDSNLANNDDEVTIRLQKCHQT